MQPEENKAASEPQPDDDDVPVVRPSSVTGYSSLDETKSVFADGSDDRGFLGLQLEARTKADLAAITDAADEAGCLYTVLANRFRTKGNVFISGSKAQLAQIIERLSL